MLTGLTCRSFRITLPSSPLPFVSPSPAPCVLALCIDAFAHKTGAAGDASDKSTVYRPRPPHTQGGRQIHIQQREGRKNDIARSVPFFEEVVKAAAAPQKLHIQKGENAVTFLNCGVAYWISVLLIYTHIHVFRQGKNRYRCLIYTLFLFRCAALRVFVSHGASTTTKRRTTIRYRKKVDTPVRHTFCFLFSSCFEQRRHQCSSHRLGTDVHGSPFVLL
jgi:hypothetical protein